MAHSPEGKSASAGGVAPAVLEGALLLHVDEGLHVLDVQRAIDLQLGVEPAHAVGLGGERHVVDGAELLELRPRRPGGGEGARRRVGGLDLLRRRHQLGPGLRRLGGIEARLLEGVLVVEHDGRRAVERHRHHAAVGQAVVALHRRHIGVRDRRSRPSRASARAPASPRRARTSWWRCPPRTSARCAARCRPGRRRWPPTMVSGYEPLKLGLTWYWVCEALKSATIFSSRPPSGCAEPVPELHLDARLRAGWARTVRMAMARTRRHEEREMSTSHAGFPLAARFSVSTGDRTFRPAPARILMHGLRRGNHAIAPFVAG